MSEAMELKPGVFYTLLHLKRLELETQEGKDKEAASEMEEEMRDMSE